MRVNLFDIVIDFKMEERAKTTSKTSIAFLFVPFVAPSSPFHLLGSCIRLPDSVDLQPFVKSIGRAGR